MVGCLLWGAETTWSSVFEGWQVFAVAAVIEPLLMVGGGGEYARGFGVFAP